MSVLQPLTDEEKYFYALMTDDTALDPMECIWEDPTKDDFCYRAWPGQWPLYRNNSQYQIDGKVARSAGKTVGITGRTLQFPWAFPGEQMSLLAPEVKHIKLVVQEIEKKLFHTTFCGIKIYSEMLPTGKNSGITRVPVFDVDWVNGSQLRSRIPNSTGAGFKGLHSTRIEIDEAQELADNAYVELIPTFMRERDRSQMRIHGVSRGIGDKFHVFASGEDPELPFYSHMMAAMYRPTWCDEERTTAIALFGGSAGAVEYIRNVFGLPGDVHNPLFVLARLMKCVIMADNDRYAEYVEETYLKISITEEMLSDNSVPIQMFIDIPGSHLGEEYRTYWGGQDVGYTRDPSEILIFGDYMEKGKLKTRLLTSIHMERVSAPDQASVVRCLFEAYGPRLRYALDKSGVGLSLWQELDPESAGTRATEWRTPQDVLERIKGYGFAEKVPVSFDDRALKRGERPEDAVVMKNTVEHALDQLRIAVDAGTIELPMDKDLINEMRGQQIQHKKDSNSLSGYVKDRKRGMHRFDALMMAFLYRSLFEFDKLREIATPEPVSYSWGE